MLDAYVIHDAIQFGRVRSTTSSRRNLFVLFFRGKLELFLVPSWLVDGNEDLFGPCVYSVLFVVAPSVYFAPLKKREAENSFEIFSEECMMSTIKENDGVDGGC